MIDFSPSIQISKKELARLQKRKDWYRKSWPGFLHGLYLQGAVAVYNLNEHFPWAFKVGICFFKDDMGTWFWDYKDLKRVRQIILGKNKQDSQYFDKEFNKWRKKWRVFKKVVDWAEKQDIDNMDERQLAHLYKKVCGACMAQASFAYITDSFLSHGEEEWLVQEIRRRWPHIAKRQDFSEVVQIFYQIGLSSFINEEVMELLKIGSLVYKKKDRLDKNILLKVLENHAKKYYWLENNYHSCRVLEPEYFFKKLKETVGKQDPNKLLQDIKQGFVKIRRDKERMLNKLKADKELRALVKLVDQLARMQDYRKQGGLRSNHFLFEVIKRISRKKKIPFHDSLFLTGPEVLKALKGELEAEELKARHKGCVYIVTRRGTALFSGKDFDRLYGPPFFVQSKKVNKIIGTPASPGKVKGRVKVIAQQKDFKLMKKGMILVTNNTTPDFVPVMKKAGAIVTDQGGLTAHAAIVSRELGVPCVIGTKIATQVLKDGEFIEVDANKGIITKL